MSSEHIMGYVGPMEDPTRSPVDLEKFFGNRPPTDNPWRSFDVEPPKDRLLEFWSAGHNCVLIGWRRTRGYCYMRMCGEVPTETCAIGLEAWREYRPER